MPDFYCVELKNSQSEKDNIVYILSQVVVLSSVVIVGNNDFSHGQSAVVRPQNPDH